MNSLQKARPLLAARPALLDRLAQPEVWDIAVVGGGATGLGVAVDAASRGLRVVLLESHDFAKGTSSRSTKLVHGGVRYLAQGNIGLVREALHERTVLMRNAPHLVKQLAFVMPAYRLWEAPFYGAGLKLYDLLAGRAGLGPTELLSPRQTIDCLPTLRPGGLKGGVKYWDGQFDDARLAIALARTAAVHGALVVNYCPVTDLRHTDGRVSGLICRDTETGREFQVAARCVVNATGVWVDQLRQRDAAGMGRTVQPMVAPSQGVHVVVDGDFLPAGQALMIPRTSDGRVLFGVPWLGKVLLGTTDTPRQDLAREPRPFRHELEFILKESAHYLARSPKPADVRSMWVGLRPLVRRPGDEDEPTQALSREHTVHVGRSGLVTVTGGKWTTYRAMAEDVLTEIRHKVLFKVPPESVTTNLELVGSPGTGATQPPLSAPPGPHLWGSELRYLASLSNSDRSLGGGLSENMVRFSARHEYARTVEDVLARRFRTLLLDARLAAVMADDVGAILEEETGRSAQAQAFRQLAQTYLAWPEPERD